MSDTGIATDYWRKEYLILVSERDAEVAALKAELKTERERSTQHAFEAEYWRSTAELRQARLERRSGNDRRVDPFPGKGFGEGETMSRRNLVTRGDGVVWAERRSL